MQISKPLRILFFLNSIFVFAGSFFGPLYAVYIQKIDQRVIVVSLSWAVFMLATTLFMYLVSRVGDRVNHKEFLLAGGFLIRAVAWLGYLFVINVQGLIIIQILLGLGESLGTPSWNALFANHLNAKKEIMQYSDWNIISNVMVALGSIVGGLLVTFYGFKILFIAMSFLAFLSFIGVFMVPKKIL